MCRCSRRKARPACLWNGCQLFAQEDSQIQPCTDDIRRQLRLKTVGLDPGHRPGASPTRLGLSEKGRPVHIELEVLGKFRSDHVEEGRDKKEGAVQRKEF